MGTTGHDAPVSLAALIHEPHEATPPRSAWREEWNRRIADVSKWEIEQRRFVRLGALARVLRRCERVGGVFGDSRRWYVREAISRLQRLAARAGGER